MSEAGKPGAGAILAGIFLVLCGLCLTLLGGGCAAVWIYVMFSGGLADAGGYLLMALVTLAAGLLLLWVGVKLLRGKNPHDPADAPQEPIER